MLKRLLPVLLLAFSCAMFAQSRFELGVRGGGSMLMYKSDFGKALPSYNLGVDLLYSYRSPYVVGFRGGVAVDVAQSIYKMSDFSEHYQTYDYASSSVPSNLLDVQYSFQSVKEAHNQIYASVPLQLGLYFNNFAVFVGPKVAIPLSATFKQQLENGKGTVTFGEYGVVTDVYKPVYNMTNEKSRLTEFEGIISGVKGLNKYKDINVMLSLDVNYYIPLSKNSSIGIGLYCDYGLPLYANNAVMEVSGQPTWKSSLMWIDDPTTPKPATMQHSHNSALNALVVGYNPGSIVADTPVGPSTKNAQMISAVNYLSFGLRVSYNIGQRYKISPKHWYKDLKKCNCVFTN